MTSKAYLTESQNQPCERLQHSNIEITHHRLLTNTLLLILPALAFNGKARDSDHLRERKRALFCIHLGLEMMVIMNLLRTIARLLWKMALHDHGMKAMQDDRVLTLHDGQGNLRII
jgi:hypothetical protein